MKKSMFIVRLNLVDVLTLSGLILSLIAASFALSGQFAFALSFLFMAMLADAFDGIMARKFGFERDFGRYLDGFVDVFDYLIVPSIFLLVWGFNTWYYGIVLIMVIVSGVIRLSVFNEVGNVKNEDDDLSYWGMPVFWNQFFLGGAFILSWFAGKEIVFPVLAVVLILFAFFMLYNGRFHKFKSWKIMLAVVLCGAVIFALNGFGIINTDSSANLISGSSIIALLINEHTSTAFLIIFPSIIGGVLHMIAVSKDWFPFLKIPVSKYLFGENKTWRGFVLMPLFTIPGAWLAYLMLDNRMLTIDISAVHFALFGAIIGLTYVLFELPNSFLKRRMGIAPGEEAKRFRTIFIILDQTDSTIGGAVAAVFIFGAPLYTGLSVLIMGPVIAFIIKQLLYILRLKKSAR
jgi:CDP-diacylglycerol--serine O-phosphatidyltransferase